MYKTCEGGKSGRGSESLITHTFRFRARPAKCAIVVRSVVRYCIMLDMLRSCCVVLFFLASGKDNGGASSGVTAAARLGSAAICGAIAVAFPPGAARDSQWIPKDSQGFRLAYLANFLTIFRSYFQTV